MDKNIKIEINNALRVFNADNTLDKKIYEMSKLKSKIIPLMGSYEVFYEVMSSSPNIDDILNMTAEEFEQQCLDWLNYDFVLSSNFIDTTGPNDTNFTKGKKFVNPKLREKAIHTVGYDQLYYLGKGGCLFPQEIEQLYNEWGKEYLKKITKTANELFDYCRLFINYIDNETKELLARRLLGRKMVDKMEVVLQDKIITSPQHLVDQMAAMVVANKLKK